MPYFEEADAIGAQVWTVGVKPTLSVGRFPVASGGSAPLSYSVMGLPDGVTWDGAAFIGAAIEASATPYDARYTVTDVNGATGSLTFEVTVNNALSFGDAVIAPQEWTAGVTPALPAATLALPAGGFPTATGGNGVLSYSITDLPAGVTYDGAAFSGAAIEASATPYNASYTVTDADGSTATLSFAVTVSAAPTFGAFVIAPQSWTVNIKPTLPPGGFPRATGGSGVLSYQMAGLPAGVTYDGTAFDGIATTPESVDATWKVTDANGGTDSLTFTVTVNLAPSFPDVTIPPAELDHGRSPGASGGRFSECRRWQRRVVLQPERFATGGSL